MVRVGSVTKPHPDMWLVGADVRENICMVVQKTIAGPEGKTEATICSVLIGQCQCLSRVLAVVAEEKSLICRCI